MLSGLYDSETCILLIAYAVRVLTPVAFSGTQVWHEFSLLKFHNITIFVRFKPWKYRME